MKIIISIFAIVLGTSMLPERCVAQQVPDDYADLWSRVDSLQSEGLPRSAADVVAAIAEQARTDGNQPHLIKSLLYRLKYLTQLEEDETNRLFRTLGEELARSEGAAKAILHSIRGEAYWRYAQANWWILQQRNTLADTPDDDIDTWDERRLVSASVRELKTSLADRELLTATPVTDFQLLLQGGRDKEIRPTLFDFLGHRAIEILSSMRGELPRPIEPFRFDDAVFLSDAAAFVRANIVTPDSLSADYHVLKVYQDLLRFHQNDRDPGPRVIADLERLAYVLSNSTIPRRQELYQQRLEGLQSEYARFPIVTDVVHALAQHINTLGGRYDPLVSDDYKWNRKEAHTLCGKAIAQHPQSFGAKNCHALRSLIEDKSVAFQMPEVVETGVPFRVRIDYRNVDRLYVRLIPLSMIQAIEFPFLHADERNAVLAEILESEPVHAREFSLPSDGDYQPHSTEIPLPELDAGVYLIVAGDGPDPAIGARGSEIMFVSRIGLLERRMSTGDMEIRVHDRQTGRPLQRARVTTWDTEYTGRRRSPIRRESYLTDRNGVARVPAGQGRSFFLTVEYNGDELVSSAWRYASRIRDRSGDTDPVTRFFTDRSIYRPGQTIYFKGVLLTRHEDRHTLRPNAKTRVRLIDPNRREIAEIELTSNEYGSVHGRFSAPTGAGTGLMTIRDDHGAVSFSVEEYKRPRFEVAFDTLSGQARLGDVVTLRGTAVAFSGAPVDAATVSYRVVRVPTFPPWFHFYHGRGGFPYGEEAEIAIGAVRTDDDGRFEVSFTAVPDESVLEEFNPIFRYQVTADVTDAAGETRTGLTSIRLGYQSLYLGVDGPEFIDRDTPPQLSILTENAEGAFVAASGKLRIVRLEPPDRVIRERLWPRVDQPIIAERMFRRDYPLDEYENELDFTSWPEAETVLEDGFDTASERALVIPNLNRWAPGRYRLELTALDDRGRRVEFRRFVTVYSTRSDRLPYPALDWFVPVKAQGEPGETASVLVGSGARDVTVFVEVEHRGVITESNSYRLSGRQKLLEFPIEERHRGNFAVHVSFVRHGRAYTHSQVVQVPYTNLQLSLHLESFRDLLLPGQQEEWRVRISGSAGEPVAAELLTSMYDLSLDQFRPHDWDFGVLMYFSPELAWFEQSTWGVRSGSVSGWPRRARSPRSRDFHRLNWFGMSWRWGRQFFMRNARVDADAPMAVAEGEAPAKADMEQAMMESGMGGDAEVRPSAQVDAVTPRRSFEETAFFFPDLRTNEKGETILSFRIPESLTKWRLMGLAHTTDLRFGSLEAFTVTRKDLMITANAPRFFRQGDRFEFAASVQNLSDTALTGTAELMLFDAFTMQAVDARFENKTPQLSITLPSGRSQGLRWSVRVPEGIEAVTYRVVARTDSHTDGEEKTVPVLTNRMLVTESLPLPMRGPGTRQFVFEKLRDQQSPTLRHHALTLEFSPNPIWYAVQALPYLMEFPHECSEQVFSRLYANSIAAHIVEQSPRMKRVYEQWRNLDSDALLSNLQKNSELKALILEETPWLLQAKDEEARKKRIAVLFDLTRMSQEQTSAIRKLIEQQRHDGAWPWFAGMAPDRYITQHIVAGIGHLIALDILALQQLPDLSTSMVRALAYLDEEIRQDYEELIRRDVNLDDRHLTRIQIHYLYARSFFDSIEIAPQARQAHDYYVGQARKYWLNNDLYAQGMIALALHRRQERETPAKILRSLREFALRSDELGMYWKYDRGYWWYQAPIETQSLLVEAFDEIEDDRESVAEMQLWLLKQKQTQDWGTTKATAEAVYALLRRGLDLTAQEGHAAIRVGDHVVDSRTADTESGTGYFTAAWQSSEVQRSMADVEVTKTGEGPAWGAVYWQYFEDLDRITPAETPLRLTKEMYVERRTSGGPVLKSWTGAEDVRTGDKVIVRITIRVDRDMEYVHLKDMRAAGLEPINVLSQYKYKDGLGYYESTRDAATHFFIGYLGKGTYVFDYPLRVNLTGDFSNGITSIQSMYAPEFASHSKGIRVQVGS